MLAETPSRTARADVLLAALVYLALTIAMTWPLATGLATDVPGDLGDSLLNMWIIGWGAEAVPRVVTGNMPFAAAWNANIFHPEPLALAFSEHLFGQVLQVLPVYYATKNLILCYNLLFLSTFVLSGCGMYLLVKELTGNRAAAFLAGLIYAFVPYRVAQIAHIQTLSSQWMPFVLWGFRKHIVRAGGAGIVFGSAALLLQNWSCGYYLIYFAPFVVLFVLHQIAAARRTNDIKLWLSFVLAAVVVAMGTWPFLAMYLAAQRVHGFERPLGEILKFSADVYSYLTAPEALRVLGGVLRAWAKPEGELFLGFVPAALALVAIAQAVVQGRSSASGSGTLLRVVPGRRRLTTRAALAALAGVVVVALSVAVIVAVFTGGFVASVGGVPFRATNVVRLIGQLAIALAALILLSGKFRAVSAAMVASPAGIAAISFVLAIWLSLGPVPRTHGEPLNGIGLYGLLLDHVPGFEGLRVPARYAMIAALYLSMLAGLGAAWMLARALTETTRRWSFAIVLAVAFLVEATFAPMDVNQTWGEGAVLPPPRVKPISRAPAVYRSLRDMPEVRAVAEFPFGDPAWELRFVYYSSVHRKPILNGYSGGFPRGYMQRVARFRRVAAAPDDAWRALVDAGTTHVIVHHDAMTPADAQVITEWLRAHGAREIGNFGKDVLFALPSAT